MSPLTWAAQHRLLTLGIGFLTLIAVVAAVGAGVWYFVLRSPATQVGLGQAIRLYRNTQKGKQVAGTGLPPSGVYQYRTSGGEQLSVGDISRSFPSKSDMIVTVAHGCATIKWEPLVQHIEGLVECAQPSGVVHVTSALSYEQIAGTQTNSVITCPAGMYFIPPHPTPGQHWRTTCHSPGETVVFGGTVVGDTEVKVQGQEVPALHTRLDLTFSGQQAGTNPNDYWVSLQNGMILRQVESVNVTQHAGPLGSVHYTEKMAIALNSVTPQR